MTSPRRLRWGPPETPTPKHPYRDTLLVYAALALFVVVFAWITGGDVAEAAEIAVAVFVAASLWSCFRWRQRLRREARQRELEAAEL